ncbi:MAG: UDP-N-acetylmuramoyl-tripeptide--D-alanyl-D-alanine ligase, partial [Verrucomicrobia bacterium]|nr:UDP-N-acetylmuramoyl-tripeptide--D-alanyl-D-alanine ligase [Verrucomicrobiota bacterium]
EVAAKNVAAVVIARSRKPSPLPACAVIAVDDVRAALGRLAAAWRAQMDLPVIAVAGSNGKTTTKELIAAVLRQKLATLASEASFNNDIGVPLTLLNLTRAHRAAVVEVGTNHPGELAPLVKMAAPQFGVITNIGREHLEFFGDIAGVAQEEGALAELLPADGKLFLNGDDAWTDKISLRTKAKVVRVGLGRSSHWNAGAVKFDRHGTTFNVLAPAVNFVGQYQIHLRGRQQVVNALFAIALGAELGLSREEIQLGLSACQPAKMRLEISEANGVTLLDDSYNANADSIAAALEVLGSLPCKGRRLAVLGDMAELGAHSAAAHEEAGRRAAESGVEQLFAVGKNAGVMAAAARTAGLTRVFEFTDVDAAKPAVRNFVKPGDVVLLSGGNFAGGEVMR